MSKDTLLGGRGADVMAGGDGNYVYELAEHFGDDTISDFEAGEGSATLRLPLFISFWGIETFCPGDPFLTLG
ncbi:MAG: hypothetical protein GKR97_09540 [Rhizobiaceae bacterium]|nr:hypothetical protein [Rhizobiaceae bacterium]